MTKPSRRHVEGARLAARRQRGHVRERREPIGEQPPPSGHRRLGAAGDHGVAAAVRDQAAGVADRMRAGGTGGDDRLARPPPAEAHRDRRRPGVAPSSSARGAARPAADPFRRGRRSAPAASRGHRLRCRRSRPCGRIGADLAGVLEGHLPRGDGELGEAVGLARPLSGRSRRAGSKSSDPSLAVSGRAANRPSKKASLADPAARDDAEPGDDDPALCRHRPGIRSSW